MRQTILCGEGGKGLAIVQAYATAMGAEPEPTVSILENREYIIVRQTILYGEGRESLSIIPAYTAFTSKV